jgi:hypothetical protein
MVVDFACEGERVTGGAGKDKVGFDPDRSGVSARIGGVITSPGTNICAVGGSPAASRTSRALGWPTR